MLIMDSPFTAIFVKNQNHWQTIIVPVVEAYRGNVNSQMLTCICYIQVVNECSGAETWLLEKKQQQDALPKHADPALLVSDLKKKAEALDRLVC